MFISLSQSPCETGVPVTIVRRGKLRLGERKSLGLYAIVFLIPSLTLTIALVDKTCLFWQIWGLLLTRSFKVEY